MVKKLDVPCVKCDWKYQGFHICIIDMRTRKGIKAATTVDYQPKVKKKREGKRSNRLDQADLGSEEHRRRISEGVRAARAAEPGRKERDAEIIRLYDEMYYNIGKAAKTVGVAYDTAKKVIHAAADRGDIVLQMASMPRSRQAVG